VMDLYMVPLHLHIMPTYKIMPVNFGGRVVENANALLVAVFTMFNTGSHVFSCIA
jgi:hypothetical protein